MAVRTEEYQETVPAILLELDRLLDESESYNYLPVAAVPITQDTGIDITGRFIFRDVTSGQYSPMCYVTVKRDMNHPFPHNGLGFAFGAESTVSGVYNIYLVDNDVLIQDIFMYNNMVIQNEGINSFLAAGRRPLVNNTWYQFKLNINEYNGMKLWIVDDTIDMNALNSAAPYYDPIGDVINTSGYAVTMGARNYSYTPLCSGNGFGIGVLGTKGGVWEFDELQITSTIPTYPFVYYKIHAPVSQFPASSSAELKWYGYGNWSNAGASGVQLWMMKDPDNAGTWEYVGNNDWVPGAGSIEDSLIYTGINNISEYRDLWGFVHVYTTTSGAYSAATMYPEYISLNTLYPSGVHQGGMIDIYVKDTTKISRTSVAGLSLIGYEIALTNLNCLSPIVAIRTVYDAVTGDELVLGKDYEIINDAVDYTYSTKNNFRIVAPTYTSIDVDYFYYQDGESMQTYLENGNVRNPATDPLIKIIAPTIITIGNLEYSGGPDAVTMRTKVKEYVQTLDREFDISKLLIYIQTAGATSFNLETISVFVTEYDSKASVIYNGTISNNYVLASSGLNCFITDEIELAGIVRV
jgi:hypothetical protein